MNYRQTIAEHLRCTLLRLLAEQSDRRLNESLLRDMSELWALNPTRDQVRSELSWLADQGLVTLRDLDGFLVAELTDRGEDVATARTTVPGVKRPSRRN